MLFSGQLETAERLHQLKPANKELIYILQIQGTMSLLQNVIEYHKVSVFTLHL